MKKLIASFLAGATVVFGGTALTKDDSCKGTTCIFEVQYNEQGNRGQTRYPKEEWDTKSEADLKADIQKRIDEKKKLLDEMSKQVNEENI